MGMGHPKYIVGYKLDSSGDPLSDLLEKEGSLVFKAAMAFNKRPFYDNYMGNFVFTLCYNKNNMSAWAYRNCGKCGNSVHINFKCDCGGDPWYIKIEAKNKLELVNTKIAELKKELDDFNDRKKALKRVLCS